MIPTTYLKLGAAAGCLLLLVTICGFVYRAGQNSIQVKWEVEKVAHAEALAAQEARHRTKERESSQAVAALWTSLQAAQEESRNELQAAIDSARTGNARLRSDLAGCNTRVPGDAAPAERDHGASNPGLSPERQSVALRTWAECDAVVHKLTAAQEYIKAIR